MKKQSTTFSIIIFLALGCFSFANMAYADTEVSGNIAIDTTWTSANSPYIVTATVQVLQGAKLTIDPGVIVKFNQNTGLNIDGELRAVGSADNLIVFTSNNTSPARGDWNGVKFSSNVIGALFNGVGEYVSGSIIKYSKIEYGGKSYYSGNISTSGGNALFVSDSIITNSAHFGIYIDSTSGSKIIRNLIENNGTLADANTFGSGGISWLACTAPVIEYNTILNNSIGILAANLNSNDFISYNNIYNNSLFNFKFITPQSLKTYDVQYNYWGSVDKTIINSKIYDYYDDISLSKVNYEPYALAELKFDGTDTFSQPSACTSWTYSTWSSCSNNGQQTRTVISSSPNSCSGGNPVLTQSCTYTPPTCTSWSYSNWSTCSNSGQQTRSTISSSPTGCAGGNPVLIGSCTYATPTCTSWVYSAWNTCANSQQTRNIESSQPSNCAGGNPVLSQSCNSTPSCTESNWTSTLTPTSCPSNGQQIKRWTKIGQCQNGTSHSSEESVSCNYQAPTCTIFTYGDWGTCNASGVQSRSTLSSSPSACVGGNPVLSQSCKHVPVEVPNKVSAVETKNNPPVSTNNEQGINQEKTVTNSQVAEQRKSDVADAVQKIIQITGKDSEVGQQVKTITETQAQNQGELETSLQKVQGRSGFAKFFVGPNYSEINNAKKLLEQNREQIKQLDEVQNQLTDKNDKQKLTEQIQLLEETNQRVETSLDEAQKGFSLLGWMFKLFAK